MKSDFPPSSSKLQPAHLVVSDRDRQAAIKKNEPPSCSVFDLEKCSIAEARVIRPSDKEAIGFGFQVPDIIDIRVHDLPALRVLRVPLDPPESLLKGADGHCGIAGLDRPEGMPNGKNIFYALRAKLADCSFRLEHQD